MAVDTLDPNLLQSARRSKGESEKPEQAKAGGRRPFFRKKLLKGLAYAAFFLWSLVTFTVLKIPDSAVTNFLLNTLNQSTPYQWQAERISLGFFPLPSLHLEKLSLEPRYPSGGLPLLIDDIRAYPSLFSLIPFGGRPAFGVSFKAEAYKSVVRGAFSTGSDLSLRLETESISLGALTPLLQSGLDLKGSLPSLFVQLSLPSQRLSLADGEIALQGRNIVFDPSSLSLPMALPLLNLGDVEAKGTLSRGQLKIERLRVGGPGRDLEIQVTSGTVALSDVMQNTRYDLHLQVRPSQAIEKAVPGLTGMLGTIATLRSDGFYAFKMQGTLAAPGFPMKE